MLPFFIRSGKGKFLKELTFFISGFRNYFGALFKAFSHDAEMKQFFSGIGIAKVIVSRHRFDFAGDIADISLTHCGIVFHPQ
ncbi:hypothetical protein RO07_01935 [Pandoraea pulmonicola]|uniref:Uncharacterized protein n=1 Tax=Pandoraea pulmonicola TaxID=93221 RepID=A0ABM5RVR9_PANPU|nr:hypothetical protein RO07_01935 [Pandoraea pulmonicola]